jgi:hypothetical protein
METAPTVDRKAIDRIQLSSVAVTGLGAHNAPPP